MVDGRSTLRGAGVPPCGVGSCAAVHRVRHGVEQHRQCWVQRISCMEVVPALAAEYLGAFREAGDSIACLKSMLTGWYSCQCI
jgi:hypothetical protein